MMKRAAVAAKSIYSGCSRLSVARNCNFQDSLQTGSNRYHVSSAGWSPSDPPSTTTTTTCTSSPGLERTGSGWSDMTFLPMSFLHIVVILVVSTEQVSSCQHWAAAAVLGVWQKEKKIQLYRQEDPLFISHWKSSANCFQFIAPVAKMGGGGLVVMVMLVAHFFASMWGNS